MGKSVCIALGYANSTLPTNEKVETAVRSAVEKTWLRNAKLAVRIKFECQLSSTAGRIMMEAKTAGEVVSLGHRQIAKAVMPFA